ncbi:MAG: DNA polymerase III subunit beta [Bacteroidales bacterium]|nr:DNA polymerase III subunit beta [Bacteroidales bacterium]
MKFQVLSSELLSHLSSISRVLSSKNAMPILENFLFNVAPDKLTITASDGDTTMVTSVALESVEGQGALVVSPKNILEPLKELPQQVISFEVYDENLEVFVTYETGKFNFIAGDAKEYPIQKALAPEAQTFTIPAPTLLGGIQSTIFATADDDLRPVMNGIFFDIREEQVVFVASDSKKLVRLINNDVKPGFVSSFILPKKPANLLKNVIAKDASEATITFDQKSARIEVGNFIVSCRLIDGRFPRYESVIPKNNINKVTIDRQTLVNVLRRVAVFANAATNQVKFDIAQDQVTISAQDIDFSVSATESVSCSYAGAPMAIGFRANFLIEILNTITSAEVEVQLSDPARAALIVPTVNEENKDLLMLIMPMMLTDF